MSDTLRLVPAVQAKREAPLSSPLPTVVVAPEPSTLEERRTELERRLQQVSAHHEALVREEKRLEGEIAEVKESLGAGRRRLPLARTLIASPCGVPWNEMQGDDRRRHCAQCDMQVHNLSAMTSDEIEAFLDANSNNRTCVRLYERTDGTILTGDCPVGVKRRRARALLLATLGAGACALFGFTGIAMAMVAGERSQPPPEPVVIQVPGPPVFVPQPAPAPILPPDYTLLPTAPNGMGWVLVHAPEDARVYDGQTLLGVGPQVVTLSEGVHSLRAEGGGRLTRWLDTAQVTVSTGGRAEVHLKKPEGLQSIAGGIPRRR